METKHIQQIPIEVEGIKELKQLLHETFEIAEQLQKNIDRISKCELEINVYQITSSIPLSKTLEVNQVTKALVEQMESYFKSLSED